MATPISPFSNPLPDLVKKTKAKKQHCHPICWRTFWEAQEEFFLTNKTSLSTSSLLTPWCRSISTLRTKHQHISRGTWCMQSGAVRNDQTCTLGRRNNHYTRTTMDRLWPGKAMTWWRSTNDLHNYWKGQPPCNRNSKVNGSCRG